MNMSIKEIRYRKKLNDVMMVVFGVCAFVFVCLAIGFAESDNCLGTYGMMALTAVCGVLSCNADVNSRYYEIKEEEFLNNEENKYVE